MGAYHLPVVRELYPDFWEATVQDGKYAGWGATALAALQDLRHRMAGVEQQGRANLLKRLGYLMLKLSGAELEELRRAA